MLELPPLTTRQFVSIQIVAGGAVGFGLGVVYGIGGLLYDLLTTGINLGSIMALAAILVMPLSGMMSGLFIGVLIAPLYKIVYDTDHLPDNFRQQNNSHG